jgi:hypothetical protein
LVAAVSSPKKNLAKERIAFGIVQKKHNSVFNYLHILAVHFFSKNQSQVLT